MAMDRWIAQAGDRAWEMRGAQMIGPAPDGAPADMACGGVGAPQRAVPALLPGAPGYVAPPGGEVPVFVQSSPQGRLGCAVAKAAGLLAERPDFDGVACITGPRCHWLRISAGEAVAFQSSLTGRLIACFGTPDTGAGFDAALDRSLSRPQALAGDLAVAEQAGQGGAVTGHLVGADLAAARPWWLGMDVVVISEGALGEAYLAGLSSQGLAPGRLDGDRALLAGLWAARQAQKWPKNAAPAQKAQTAEGG